MKTAYELAMERLNRSAPTPKLTERQKRELAELDSQCRAKIAEREIAFQAEIDQARARGDTEAADQRAQLLAAERRKLQAEFDEKKERVRQGERRS